MWLFFQVFVLALSAWTTRTLSTTSYGPCIQELVTQASSLHAVQADSNTIFRSEYAPSLTVLTPLLNGKVSVHRSQALYSFPNFIQGSFFIQAPENHAVIAIFQNLALSHVTGNTQKCYDFIQFTDVAKGRKSPSICGTNKGQDVDLEPATLIGPRTFIASSGTVGVKLFVFTNKLHNDDMDASRGAMTVQLSFTAVPKERLFNLAGILLMTHMRICQFLHYNYNKISDTWIYCPNPTVPDCVHVSLYCGNGDSDIQCTSPDSSVTSDYGIDPALCDQFNSGDLNPHNLTNEEKTWWRLSELETKAEESSSKLLITQFIIMAVGGILVGIFASVFLWRLLHFCWPLSSNNNESEGMDEEKKESETKENI